MVEFRGIRRVSQKRFHDPTPRFPPLAPVGGRSPASAVLSRRYDILPSVPPHFVSFAWRYLAFTRSVRSPADECAAGAWSWSPGDSGREFHEETTGSPKFLGTPPCPFAHVQSTPAGLRTPDHCGAAAWPLVCQQQRLPRRVFRRSIAWLSNWLSTLRSAGYPDTTQDSLPAAGQALPDGLCTRRVPLKSFRVVSLHLILPSQASWRNDIDRRAFGTATDRPGFCTEMTFGDGRPRRLESKR
jgi:hypothetical protein